MLNYYPSSRHVFGRDPGALSRHYSHWVLGGVNNYLSKRDSEAFFVLAPNVGALGEARRGVIVVLLQRTAPTVGALGDAASAEKGQNLATNGDC